MSFVKTLSFWEKDFDISAANKLNLVMRGRPTLFDLEGARLANVRGDWSKAIEIASRALTNTSETASTLSMLQIRAHAFFEQSRFAEALADLERIETLCGKKPKKAAFHGHVLKARILARTKDLALGRSLLDALWNEEDLNADLLQTLLTAEIDLRRLERKPLFDLCISNYQLAQNAGDLLHPNLALVDIFYAASWDDRMLLQDLLIRAQESFVRVQKLCEDIECEYPFSATAQTIKYNENFSEEVLFTRETLQAALHGFCDWRSLVTEFRA
jgi:hypothetical protein